MAEISQGDILTDALRKSQLAGDLVEAIQARRAPDGAFDAKARGFRVDGTIPVIIEGNAHLPGGARRARALLAFHLAGSHDVFDEVKLVYERADIAVDLLDAGSVIDPPSLGDDDSIDLDNSFWTDQYLFARLGVETIRKITGAALIVNDRRVPLVHKIWLNHAVSRFVFESGKTVKCDAARAAFSAAGEGVVWAVADTGIDRRHHHFRAHATLVLPDGIEHKDFTGSADPLVDDDGHGTHVAGIIAGATVRRRRAIGAEMRPRRLVVQQKVRTSDAQTDQVSDDSHSEISGVAPLCKLVSLKVLQNGQSGDVANLLAAIGYIQSVNNNGRNLRIHGLNLSLGYTFDARWFAAGQSPLCVEVDRLVRSGVVVVVAAGNSGYGTVQTLNMSMERASHLATISDPGNAELAITVGSTHRDSPHSFGVSYFSAKGPTADGRMKPDLVAPGERIVSAGLFDPGHPDHALFHEDSGTSMAAPHVSGAIAAFLSVRREFKGRPERVKQIFVESATDIRRRPEFQGAGLIDVMRALQSV